MFFDVESGKLLFFRDPDTHGELQDKEGDEGEDESEQADGQRSDHLRDQAVIGIEREQADGDRPPDAADSVNRDCADRGNVGN